MNEVISQYNIVLQQEAAVQAHADENAQIVEDKPADAAEETQKED